MDNDVSARDTPSPLGRVDLFSMKALDRTTPLGPWITTKDESGGSGQPDLLFNGTTDGVAAEDSRYVKPSDLIERRSRG
ncbi:fumarylacetoacetate hydrolase family protein [Streptomyces sp. NBC_00075]|uniref:fumarylacetoacetate hydrolase family protein n=1 Tax=Streptomyces sp. NBC_00075 TaxID=2975641 RepID=UPI00324E2C51